MRGLNAQLMTARIDERTTGLDRTLHDLLKIEPLAAQLILHRVMRETSSTGATRASRADLSPNTARCARLCSTAARYHPTIPSRSFHPGSALSQNVSGLSLVNKDSRLIHLFTSLTLKQ